MNDSKCEICGMETKYHGPTCSFGGQLKTANYYANECFFGISTLKGAETLIALVQEEALRYAARLAEKASEDCNPCSACDIYRAEFMQQLERADSLEKQSTENCLEWQEWEHWAAEVLTDFKIPYDNHKIGMRMALTQWMADKLPEQALRPGWSEMGK